MKNFEATKIEISKLFENRKGFTNDVLDSITACYLYLLNNFDVIIPNNQVPDNNTFKINSNIKNGRTLANIFINRINNNVLSITNQTKATGQYFAKKKMIAISNSPHILHTYNYLNLNNHQLKVLEENLKAKVIAHELFHASTDNGTLIGFMFRSDMLSKRQQYIDTYLPSTSQTTCESIYLEEMITEIFALNTVNIHTISKIENSNKKLNFQLNCRNINSCNAPINPIGEYFIRCFDDIIQAKFTNGVTWLANFIKLHEYFGTTQTNFIYKFNNYLKFIANYSKSTIISYSEKSLRLIKKCQLALLNYYIDNLCLTTKQECEKSIKDYVAFNIFAVKENNIIPTIILDKLNELKATLEQNANLFNLDFNSTFETEYNKQFGISNANQIVLNKPYSNLQNNNIEKIITSPIK